MHSPIRRRTMGRREKEDVSVALTRPARWSDGRAEGQRAGSLDATIPRPSGLYEAPCRPDRRGLLGRPLRVSHGTGHQAFSGCLGGRRRSARRARAHATSQGRSGWLATGSWLWCRVVQGGWTCNTSCAYAYPASPACPPGRPSGGLLEGVWKVGKRSIVGLPWWADGSHNGRGCNTIVTLAPSQPANGNQ